MLGKKSKWHSTELTDTTTKSQAILTLAATAEHSAQLMRICSKTAATATIVTATKEANPAAAAAAAAMGRQLQCNSLLVVPEAPDFVRGNLKESPTKQLRLLPVHRQYKGAPREHYAKLHACKLPPERQE
ncbi:hypothetical protein ETH_00006445 [Eimeria tenella]|uniref:Uncharacterized protein n=1 Tax=Eimeria tenella TaxID=5802 RepID=U6KH80_EIMTE|nr:hypothetical protein ETH_00006445 [Eimeria tenella]CDJ37350.1 hypothetical protein ETH_00006445 [Eimeria tenella]|eukprot:XP_013228188.1 hypothetical protein ETH_00006445 [Eimeria tenella]